MEAPLTDEEHIKNAWSLHPEFRFAGKALPEVVVMGEDEKDEEEDPHILIQCDSKQKS